MQELTFWKWHNILTVVSCYISLSTLNICTIYLTTSYVQTDSEALLKQTTFEIIVGKGEIAHNEQFLLLPQPFQLFLNNLLYTCTFILIDFPYFHQAVFKVVCCIFVLCSKGLNAFILYMEWTFSIIKADKFLKPFGKRKPNIQYILVSCILLFIMFFPTYRHVLMQLQHMTVGSSMEKC